MTLISTTSKYVGLSSDLNADAEIDDETTSCSPTSTDIEHNLQVENTITSDPAIRSTRQKCFSFFLCLLYLIAMIGSLYVGVIIICGTPGNGLNPLAANMLGVLLISIGVLLFCLPFAVMIRGCYRKDPTQTIKGFSIVLCMWAAGIVGSFLGIYTYLAILRLGQPCALLSGVPLSLLACFILGCRRKALLIQNMLHEFYWMLVAVTVIVVNPIPFGIILFFNEKTQETVRTAPLVLFIWTVFWQFLFLTTATMTWINLIILSGVNSAWALVPLFLWPFLLYRLDKISASFVDWLVVTHGQQHPIMVVMLVPRFEIVNDTEDVISSNQIEINVISPKQIEIV